MGKMPRERPRTRDLSNDEDQYIILVKDIPRHCRWQELKDMTRSLGGEQSLKAEVFELQDGSQLGHCTIKGRVAANQVYEKFCDQGWNGQCVCVSLAVLEKPGVLKTLEGPRKTCGSTIETRISPKGSYPGPSAALNSIQACAERPSVYAGTHRPLSKAHSVGYERAAAATPLPPVSPYSTTAGDAEGSGRTAPLAYPYQNVSQYPTSGNTSLYSSAVIPVVSATGSGYRPANLAETQAAAVPAATSTPIHDGSTIFISGLPHNQAEPQLRNLLKRYGSLIYLEYHPDSRSPGKGKGTARARYRTPTEALNAVRDLDGAYLGNRKISVRQMKGGPEAVVSVAATKKTATAGGTAPTGQQKKRVPTKPAITNRPLGPAEQHGRQGRNGNSDKAGSSSGSFSSVTGPLIVNGAAGSTGRRCSSQGGRTSSSDDDNSDSNEDGTDGGDTDSCSENETSDRADGGDGEGRNHHDRGSP